MKKLHTLLLLMILPAILFAQDEVKEDRKVDREIKGGIIFGTNISQIEGDQVYNFNKLGIHAGFAGILPIGKRFSFEVETIYNEKGSYRKYPFASDSGSFPFYKCNLTYLEVPLMFHYEDRHTWTFGLGLSYGRLVKAKEIEWGGTKDWYRYPNTKNDYNIIADLRFRLYKHLKFNVRYSYSLASTRKRTFMNERTGDTWERNQYNNVITVRLIYLLNEKYLPERTKRVKKKKNK